MHISLKISTEFLSRNKIVLTFLFLGKTISHSSSPTLHCNENNMTSEKRFFILEHWRSLTASLVTFFLKDLLFLASLLQITVLFFLSIYLHLRSPNATLFATYFCNICLFNLLQRASLLYNHFYVFTPSVVLPIYQIVFQPAVLCVQACIFKYLTSHYLCY